MGDKVVLTIDCGTQSLRAFLFSTTGNLLEMTQVQYAPYVSKNPGWVEQDPEVYWNSLCDACKRLKDRQPGLFEAVAAVGITSQRNSMINVDNCGAPLRPTVTWLDQRMAEPSLDQEQLQALGLDSPELALSVRTLQAQGKCNWIRQNQPEIWAATHKYLQVSGFLNYRLTSHFVDSVASQIGYIPFDYAQMRWAGEENLFAVLFPVEREKLPKLVRPGEPVGNVTLEASSATGIKQGVPVIACGSDKGCETLGAGVIDASMANFSFGTTATIQTTTERYFEAVPFIPPYPAVVPGCHNPEIMIPRGFLMISWFKDEFGFEQVQEARATGVAVEEIFDRYLAQTPPGAMGLIIQPHWGGALDNPFAKGAMVGFGDVHTKAYIYRGIIEGLMFALRDAFEKIQSAGELKIKRITVSGGASQSDEICQIAADVLGVPLIKIQTHEASGLGAALITATGAGLFTSLSQASEKMVKVGKIYRPDQQATALYQSLYARVYQQMMTQPLELIYSEIREITGYPK